MKIETYEFGYSWNMSSWTICGVRLIYKIENNDDEDNEEDNHAYETEDGKENNKYDLNINYINLYY